MIYYRGNVIFQQRLVPSKNYASPVTGARIILLLFFSNLYRAVSHSLGEHDVCLLNFSKIQLLYSSGYPLCLYVRRSFFFNSV